MNLKNTWISAAADRPAPATAPIGTKRWGKAGVMISIPKAAFSKKSANNLHPFGFTSKCRPNFDKKILLRYPIPSLSTQFTAAAVGIAPFPNPTAYSKDYM